jgi:hypothetical protein
VPSRATSRTGLHRSPRANPAANRHRIPPHSPAVSRTGLRPSRQVSRACSRCRIPAPSPAGNPRHSHPCGPLAFPPMCSVRQGGALTPASATLSALSLFHGRSAKRSARECGRKCFA